MSDMPHLRVRLPADLHAALTARAEAAGKPLNHLIVEMLTEANSVLSWEAVIRRVIREELGGGDLPTFFTNTTWGPLCL